MRSPNYVAILTAEETSKRTPGKNERILDATVLDDVPIPHLNQKQTPGSKLAQGKVQQRLEIWLMLKNMAQNHQAVGVLVVNQR